MLAVHHLELQEDWDRGDKVDRAGWSTYLGNRALNELARQYCSDEAVYEAYFGRLRQAMNTGFQNICPMIGLAHLVVFTNKKFYDPRKAEPFIEPILQEAKDDDFAVDQNFHYYDETGEPRPNFDIGRRFRAMGGEVWFGSDAHSAEQLFWRAL